MSSPRLTDACLAATDESCAAFEAQGRDWMTMPVREVRAIVAELRATRAHGGTGDGEVEALAEEALRLDAEATPGPWTPCLGSGMNVCTGLHHTDEERITFIADLVPDYAIKSAPGDHGPNMRFIARARTLLPALARAYLDALRSAPPVASNDGPKCDCADRLRIRAGFESRRLVSMALMDAAADLTDAPPPASAPKDTDASERRTLIAIRSFLEGLAHFRPRVLQEVRDDAAELLRKWPERDEAASAPKGDLSDAVRAYLDALARLDERTWPEGLTTEEWNRVAVERVAAVDSTLAGLRARVPLEVAEAPKGDEPPTSWDDPRLANDPNRGRMCGRCGGIVPAGTRYNHGVGLCAPVASPPASAPKGDEPPPPDSDCTNAPCGAKAGEWCREPTHDGRRVAGLVRRGRAVASPPAPVEQAKCEHPWGGTRLVTCEGCGEIVAAPDSPPASAPVEDARAELTEWYTTTDPRVRWRSLASTFADRVREGKDPDDRAVVGQRSDGSGWWWIVYGDDGEMIGNSAGSPCATQGEAERAADAVAVTRYRLPASAPVPPTERAKGEQ